MRPQIPKTPETKFCVHTIMLAASSKSHHRSCFFENYNMEKDITFRQVSESEVFLCDMSKGSYCYIILFSALGDTEGEAIREINCLRVWINFITLIISTADECL